MKMQMEKMPGTIKKIIELLGCTPPSEDMICDKQPSYYIESDLISDKFSIVAKAIETAGVSMNDLILKQYRMFKEIYKKQSCLEYNTCDLVIYFLDWYLYGYLKGYSISNYFDYEFYHKELEERVKFLGKRDRVQIYKICTDEDYKHIMMNKADFYSFFHDYVNRSWLYPRKASKEEFIDFINRFPCFFAKPIGGSGGTGARKIYSDRYEINELYDICIRENLIIEEVILQHAEIAKFNSSTINTIRINTLNCIDGTIRVTGAFGRFGTKNIGVDNYASGGIGVKIDLDSGEVVSEARKNTHESFRNHPDSQFPFLGFKYPKWENVMEAVIKSAEKLPQVRSIGWDVSILEDGSIEFVEGNCGSDFDVLQINDQVGRKHLYEKYVKEIKEKKRT